MSEHVRPPTGAWGAASHQPLAPNAGHGWVIVVSIALATGLIASSTAVAGIGLVALLMVLIGFGALVVPVAIMIMTWARARGPVRGLFALAGLACLLLVGFAVVRIGTIAPVLLSS
jgi:hypothetical protein